MSARASVKLSVMIGIFQISAAGAVVGLLGAVGIYWAPEEPYPHFIVASGTLKGILMGLLIRGYVHRTSSIARATGVGGGFGLVVSAMVFLAKGGWESLNAPYVVPTGVVEGVVLGVLVRWLAKSSGHHEHMSSRKK